jgi:hypothetical protein
MKRFYPVVLMLALCGAHGFARTIAPPQKQQQANRLPTDLAVEIRNAGDGPTYIPGNGGVWMGRFGRIAEWRPPAGFLPVRAVDFSSHVVNETTLEIKVSLHRGERQFDEQTPVAVYQVREGETAVAEELKQFGLLPIEFKVLRAKRPADALPYVESPTTALGLVGVERLDTPFPSYTVRLRNLSGKDIAALVVHSFTARGLSGSTRPWLQNDEPLIKAGEVFEFRARGGSEGQLTAEGFVPDGLQRVFIPTVLFTDGTFEGEPWPAAKLLAHKEGRKLQLARALAVVKNSLQTIDARGEAFAVARFRAQVAALAEEVEPQTVETVAAKFPALSSAQKAELREGVRFYLHQVKIDLLKSVREFEDAGGGANAPRPAFRQWLAGVKENYERWLARL